LKGVVSAQEVSVYPDLCVKDFASLFPVTKRASTDTKKGT